VKDVEDVLETVRKGATVGGGKAKEMVEKGLEMVER